jgi:hypothetical protein
VEFELKEDKFSPSQLGPLDFFLKALNFDVKKPNEKPIIPKQITH